MYPNSVFNHAVGAFNDPMVPPTTEPGQEPTATVRVSCEWLPFIRGALSQLLLQSTWKTDEAGLQSIQERVWTLIALFKDETCEMCDCITFVGGYPAKFVPDGHGGGSFVPIDPRTDGTVAPPWPTPPAGQTGDCLSGANFSAFFGSAMGFMAQALSGAAEFASIVVGLVDFLELTLGPFALFTEFATNMVVGAADAGAALFGVAFNSSTQTAAYDLIKCAFQCAANADGSITSVGIDKMIDIFNLGIDAAVTNGPERALWQLIWPDFVRSQGPNGLTRMGRLAGINSADCTGCDCGWESLFDFTATDYASLVYDNSPYSAGHGYVAGTYGGYYNAAFVQFQLSPQKDITHVTIEYTAHFNASVTQRKLIVTYYPEQGVDASALPQGDHISDGFNALHTAQDYVFADLLANDTAAVIQIHRMLVRGNGTKPVGWP